MKFRKITLKSGTEILLGKDEKSNDELMKQYEGKENTIIHTSSPGSPFCVIEDLDPSNNDLKVSGSICASYSQDWRDNKGDIKVDIFTGKDVSKKWWMKPGTWKVKKAEKMIIKRKDILKFKER